MNRRLITAGLALGIILLIGAVFTAYRGLAAPGLTQPELRAFAPPLQWNLPTEGWQVCRVGSSEPIEGVGDRQVFDLCHSQGWQLKTYCLDPGMPIPAIGAQCSQVVGGTYWCGDGVQQLGLIEVLQAPETATVPTATAVASATGAYPPPPTSTEAYPPPPTATVPATATVSATATVPATATVSATAVASATGAYPPPPTQPTSPPPTRLATVIVTQVIVTPISTPYNRPYPGGPGNLDLLAGNLGALAAMGAAGGAAAAAWRSGRARRGARRLWQRLTGRRRRGG